jgi:hypothetical protein
VLPYIDTQQRGQALEEESHQVTSGVVSEGILSVQSMQLCIGLQILHCDLGDQRVLVCCGGNLQPPRLRIVAQPPPARTLHVTDVLVNA